MPADSNGLILLIPLMIGLFVMMAHIDIYLSKRRHQIANARYLAAMDAAERVSSPAPVRLRSGAPQARH